MDMREKIWDSLIPTLKFSRRILIKARMSTVKIIQNLSPELENSRGQNEKRKGERDNGREEEGKREMTMCDELIKDYGSMIVCHLPYTLFYRFKYNCFRPLSRYPL